jgi:hypothetical protein
MTQRANSISKSYTMLAPAPFAIHHPDYTVVRLTWRESDCLQALFECCIV